MDHIDELAAAAVRDAYKSAGVTIDKLSEDTGISFTTLKRRLSGRTSFRLDELVRIAQALDVPFSDLVPELDATRGVA
ncbi:helix-turn-helix domain-containing protein [Rhodococcus sp. HS-D2]|uniref:helix-turn-helix domain-containing protein n=1 Tax=Rhodococcus sp. HS-D2 TaxID=1384636 RepID=UPI000A5C8F7E|nr:helix-turn-helix transcriptional regulator [Rhodococcus sp. HS-D2]